MIALTDTLAKIAILLKYTSDFTEYEQVKSYMLNNLDAIHWNDEFNLYCDVSINDDGTVFSLTVDVKLVLGKQYHAIHRGYVSLFPFLFGYVDADSIKLGFILDMMSDAEHLWSE